MLFPNVKKLGLKKTFTSGLNLNGVVGGVSTEFFSFLNQIYVYDHHVKIQDKLGLNFNQRMATCQGDLYCTNTQKLHNA